MNGVGKSNLFDAITFLGALAEKPLHEAALSVRSEGGRASDLRSIFYRIGDEYAEEMTFEAEMLIPPTGVDDLGQAAKAAITFLSYRLTLGRSGSGLTIQREELTHITQGGARKHLHFPHSVLWRESVVTGRRTSPFISTEKDPPARRQADIDRSFSLASRDLAGNSLSRVVDYPSRRARLLSQPAGAPAPGQIRKPNEVAASHRSPRSPEVATLG